MPDSNDSLVRSDLKSQELAYNNTTDRMKVELPGMGDPASLELVKKRFTYNVLGDVATIKEADVATASGSPCKLSTFTYNGSNDVDYIVESVSTW